MNTQRNYWQDCIAEAADECALTLTPEQLYCLAAGAEGGHEHYGMAFYSPPPSDRLNEIERESGIKLKAIQNECDRYRTNAETAIKQALGQHCDALVTIGELGEVFFHGGRTERIQ